MKTSLSLSFFVLLYTAFKMHPQTKTVILNEIYGMRGVNKPETPDNPPMTLLDKQENKISLEDLLKKHKGKVVYVDFWASWCKPCRLAIPHSKKLKETLNDIPVVFVYLSIDSMVKPWKQASVTDKLADYTENYLVFNWEESAFIKKYKISSIPRYMIFDKDGQLVDAMAPGPVNEDAEEVLRKLAKQSNKPGKSTQMAIKKETVRRQPL